MGSLVLFENTAVTASEVSDDLETWNSIFTSPLYTTKSSSSGGGAPSKSQSSSAPFDTPGLVDPVGSSGPPKSSNVSCVDDGC